MTDQEIEERLARDDAFWTGPRLVGLLLGTLAVAFTVIFVISSLKSGDYTWHPLANPDPFDLRPSE